MRHRHVALLSPLCALVLAACGGGVQGSYLFGEDGEGITLELRGGDVAVVSIAGLAETEGTYSVDGDTVTLEMDGETESFTIVDGNLSRRAFGEEILFVKQ